jgi:hypothetical protein
MSDTRLRQRKRGEIVELIANSDELMTNYQALIALKWWQRNGGEWKIDIGLIHAAPFGASNHLSS